MRKETLEYAMRICIKGPQQLSERTLEHIIDEYKEIKRQKIALEIRQINTIISISLLYLSFLYESINLNN